MPGRAGTRPAIEPCRDEQGLDLQRVTCNWPPATTHVDIRQDIEYAGSCRLSRGSSLSDQEAGGANQAGAGLTDSEKNVNDRKEPEEAVMLRRLKMKLRALFDKTRMESELDRELRFHLDREIEKNLQGGLRFEEARTVALRSFDGMARPAVWPAGAEKEPRVRCGRNIDAGAGNWSQHCNLQCHQCSAVAPAS